MDQLSKVIQIPTSADARLTAVLGVVLRLEEQGKYAEAVSALSAFWRGPGHQPSVRLPDREHAQLWVRAGSLTAVLGSQQQRRGWQEEAKNLLTVAARKAVECGAHDVWLEAQKELGNCYWWEGAFSEARVILTAAVEQSDEMSDIGLLLRINGTMVDRSEQRYAEALVSLKAIAPSVAVTRSNTIKSRFHNALALSYRAIGEIDSAIIEMTACCYYLEQAKNERLLIGAEINLGHLCISGQRFDEALERFSKASKLAVRLDDSIHLAHAKDSMAMAYLARREFQLAEQEATEAVAIFERGDQYALLVDALITLARAFTGQGCRAEACGVYVRAQQIASEKVSSKKAADVGLELIRTVAGALSLEVGMTYEQLVEEYKQALIDSALNVGGVTEAALRLGMKHQHLSWLLNNTYPHLRRERPRRQSIIVRPSSSKKSPKQ